MTGSDVAVVVLIIIAVVVAARIVLTANRRYIDETRDQVVHDLRGPWCTACGVARVRIEGARCDYCRERVS